jgi:uncharacterized membrane-anchored protein YhcB (DUF1043 family)
MEFLINKKHWILLALVLALPFLIYIYFMFINPFIDGGWNTALKVWSAWQSLNVGFLALASSFVAFYIAHYSAEKKRVREFVAAKAFLPEALSELTSYFEQSAILYAEAYRRASDNSDRCKTQLNSVLPTLPTDYKNVFSHCIHSATPVVGEHLANILSKLQVHHARLNSEYKEFNPDSNMIKIPVNIMSNIFCLGQLQALVIKLIHLPVAQKKLIFLH